MRTVAQGNAVDTTPPVEPGNGGEYPAHVGLGDFVYRELGHPPIVGASGCTLTDASGNVLLDAEAANGTVAFGYDASIAKEVFERVLHLPALPSFLESELRLSTASRLADWIGQSTHGAGRVAFEIGGAAAIELAVKIARANASGDALAVLEGGYHGRSVYASQLSASARYRSHNLVSPPNLIRLPCPDREQQDGRAERSVEDWEYWLDRLLTDDAKGAPKTYFALILEPVLNVGGMRYPSPAYLSALVRWFRRRGAMIVADEIFTGFYRTGRRFGFEHYDFVPDIVVASKGLSNGLAPVACVWAREPLLSASRFAPGTHSVTYANCPINVATADVVLGRFQAWGSISSDVQTLEGHLLEAVEELKRRHAVISSVSAMGATARLSLRLPIADKIRCAARGSRQSRGRYGGALVSSTGMVREVIGIHPPLIFTKQDSHEMVEILSAAIKEIADDV